jgi:hyperosmotically inducible periplasmic protein
MYEFKGGLMLLRKLRWVVLAMVLVVGGSGCQAMTGETLGEHIDDTTITTTVKTRLAAEKGTTLTRVQVDTDRGVVQLSGVVETAADRARAEQIARGVGGVKSVRNNLQTQR